ncbi:MAG TPA: DUF488 domain-containing protein [Acidimicrobiales bacterium]|nr:DUF488 domain-containing protein [Acidimicrobiales bacterium]
MVTVGYEGRSVDQFFEDLMKEGVARLVDVRQNAISRKAGFSKRALAAQCEQHGIDYVHRPELGNPRENRDAYRAGSSASRERYLRHIESCDETLHEIIRLLESRTVALLCFEADHEHCHRSLLAERIRAAAPQVSVRHA